MKEILNNVRRPIILFVIFVISLVVSFSVFSAINKNEELSYTKLVSCVNSGEVESIVIDSSGAKAEVKLKNDDKVKSIVIPSEDSITELLTQNELKGNHIEFSKKEATAGISSIASIISLLFTLIINSLFIALIFFLFKSMKRTIGNTDGGSVDVQNDVKIRFSDVAGIEPQKEELVEIVSFLKDSDKYKKIGAKIPKGLLLYGEPGTGKTLLAKAIAGEANVPFFNMNGSEFEEMFVGLGASRVRSLFKKARDNAPSIIFIDELDSIGGKRGGRYNYSEQTLNQLLVEMDGFKDDNVIVIAATNRVDSLDPAVLRPGRFDRKIFVPTPDVKGREEILKIHTKNLSLDDDVSLKEIATKTAGYTGAELANVSNEAAIFAVRNNHTKVSKSDMDEALRKQMIGIAEKNKVISDEVKNLVSYHEAGHALVSHFVGEKSKIVEISIISRGCAGGYTMYEDTDDNLQYMSKKACLNKITSLLAGRAAEKLILGDVSTGAQNDLERATKLATLMVTKYGMSEKIGPIALTDEEILYLNKDFSNPINVEIKSIIQRCSNMADQILKDKINLLHALAGELANKETISGDEFRSIVSN